MSNKSTEIPFCSSFKIPPSSQTLSKALDVSKNTLLTSNPSLIDLQIFIYICFYKQLVYTGITWFKTGLVRWNKFVFQKNPKHFVKNKSFKTFTTNSVSRLLLVQLNARLLIRLRESKALKQDPTNNIEIIV